MTDRYRGYPPPSPSRSATFNAARSSMPTSIGYSSMYAGDMHVMPSATSMSPHYITTPRGYTTSTTASGVPTTTRTYAVTSDNRQRPGARDSSRTRRSTLDSTSRPPVIITTTQTDRPHASSSHTRSGSPMRDEYRSSDGQFYAQPASSIRSRSTARPYHVGSNSEDYGRSRERSDSLLSPREVDVYRSSRPSVVYPSDPRHSTAALDYGDDGYQYTNAGELARYDLDHPKPSHSRRHDSMDRGYYRPNINYNADQRSFNVNTSHDLSRNYNMNTSRPYEGVRGGPPPSTRGFDKINRGYEAARDVPPAAPVPPSPTTTQSELAGAPERREAGRRSRPLSLHQDSAPRSSHHDDFHRSREDERSLRDLRERERDTERLHDPPRFRDEGVATRGFGIRTDLLDASADRRREPRLEEPRKRSDEDLVHGSDLEREERRRSRQAMPEERRDRRESTREGDEGDRERPRIREKLAAGLGIAAAAVGYSPETKGDKKEMDAGEPQRRRSPDEDLERRRLSELAGHAAGSGESRKPERTRERAKDDSEEAVEVAERHRRDAEAKLVGEAVVSASDSDDSRRTSRRKGPSPNTFNPNDASDLKQIKEQLAAMEVSGKGEENDREKLSIEGKPRSRSPSSAEERRSGDSSRDHSRGRELVAAAVDEKQVRVVSPPKDKSDDKPLRGILKQPRVRFPEEANPIREGVAPHKEDKKLKEAPPGARWTKINRKIVNPEALTVGKERFEVRDDFVIVLRVLSKEEIQAYAAATQVLRERRRNKVDADRERDRDRENNRDQDGEGSRRHRSHHHHRHRDEDSSEVDDKDRDRNRERRRRHRRDEGDEYEPRTRESEQHHHRSFRERERERDRDRAAEV